VDRADAGRLGEARARRRVLDMAERDRLRDARVRTRRAVRPHVGDLGRDLEGGANRGALDGAPRARLNAEAAVTSGPGPRARLPACPLSAGQSDGGVDQTNDGQTVDHAVRRSW